MIQKVEKRDGRIVAFDRKRIALAISKAMAEINVTDADLANDIALYIETKIDKECLSVADIQVLVENQLMKSDMPDVARAYIIYRNKRDKARHSHSNQIISDIIAAKKNDITRENANMNADTPAGMMMKVSSERTKEYVDEFLLSEDVRKAVDDNLIHVHDKDYYPTKSLTCLQHPVNKILGSGFSAGHGESRPAKRIETASILSCISMEAVQNEMHGGQAIPAFDFYLAPFVRKTYIEEIKKIEALTGHDLSDEYNAEIGDYIITDVKDALGQREAYKRHAINMTVDRVHQSMEAFIHNMNTIHSRGGNQVVFSSINFGTDTSAEGRCIIRELLLSTYEGVGNHATAIFPISIWKCKRGVSYLPTDPNYDLYQLACKVTAKRFFPNFLNMDATFNQNENWKADDPNRYLHEVATMGCRTRVFENRFGEKTSVGRGNLSFTTVNLPGIALACMNLPEEVRVERFIDYMDYAINIAGKQLHERYEFQCTALAKQFPLLMSGMWIGSENLKPDDEVRSVLKHGTLGIGFIGLAECLIALCGKHHGESDEAQKLGLNIIGHFRNTVAELAEKYDLNYSVLATPAEGLSGRFTKRDRKKYGVIPGVTDKEYYTNSNHVPVYYKCSAEHKAIVEAPYHDLTRGGHIFYVELDGDATHNVEAVSQIVDLMMEHNIGYGSINHNRNRCLDCSYEDASSDLKECPICGSHRIDKLQRITGYLVGTTDRWNSGKLAELNDRVAHGIKE